MRAVRLGRIRLGIRSRVAWYMALGALLLSLTLSTLTFALVRNFLIDESERSSIETARTAAEYLAAAPAADEDVPATLAQVGGSDSTGLLRRSGQWFAESLETTPEQLPEEFLEGLSEGRGQLQRTEVGERPVLAVSFPLPETSGTYVELFPLETLDRTLRTLGWALLGASSATVLVGAALGYSASRSALRPLEQLNEAAAAVAAGDLEARLAEGGDPDLDRLARTFNESTRMLEERVRRDERFASDVSHELRSPLTTILNSVEVLRSRAANLPEEGREALELLIIEVKRLHQVTIDLLETSRDATSEEALEILDVSQVVERTMQVLAPEVPVEVSPAAQGARIRGDVRRIQQILRNLVSNGQTHGRGVTQVVIDATRGSVTISVDDEGEGVDPQWRERVFERFTRGPGAVSTPEEPGTGLGLAVVQRQVRHLSGNVEATTGPTGGRFTVTFPREKVRA